MLWLIGLMSVMAASAIVMVDTAPEEDGEDTPQPATDTENNGDILSGTDAADTLNGTVGDDQIGGYGGDDLIEAGRGDDVGFGDSGDDTLNGEEGQDTLHGGTGADALRGGEGDDTIVGQSDNDMLIGGAGDDALQGSAGDDTLFGGAGADALLGGLDDDLLQGGRGADTLFGGWGNDTLSGIEDTSGDARVSEDAERDYLNGGGGDDVILAGGDDIVTAGDGADQIILGDWIADTHPAEVLDYDPREDSLVLVWDDTDGETNAPDPTLTDHPTDSDRTLIFLGDSLIGNIKSEVAFDLGDVTLVPLSAAGAIGIVG